VRPLGAGRHRLVQIVRHALSSCRLKEYCLALARQTGLLSRSALAFISRSRPPLQASRAVLRLGKVRFPPIADVRQLRS
jgi:hypothetical protein